ncbi:MAG TPA: hypothetical protein VMB66_15055 [Candidatus Acidoferrales bacterium]|nr:hypothetical protein [Candidatus Acidoferrales bacterium]
MINNRHYRRIKRSFQVAIAAALFSFVATIHAADSVPQVTLDVAKAGPRAVESLTARSVVRDYKLAWMNLSHALESNSTVPLSGLFDGTAKAWLSSAVDDQQRTGLTRRYLNQSHRLEAVFYAPEGDVMELHDTAEYDLQISDGSKTIHNEHATVHYVVLMTPGADRWVVRQLQAVPNF